MIMWQVNFFYILNFFSFCKTRVIRHNNVNKISDKYILHKLIKRLSNVTHFVRVNMVSWSKQPLKDLADIIKNRLNLVCKTFKYSELYLAVTDAIESKLYESLTTTARRKTPENICKLNFFNKAIELFNLPSLFNNMELTSLKKSTARLCIAYSCA